MTETPPKSRSPGTSVDERRVLRGTEAAAARTEDALRQSWWSFAAKCVRWPSDNALVTDTTDGSASAGFPKPRMGGVRA
ncbi:hypothetical protein [Actinophytocola oryzae]|uniref:Uncharacterized protein n=1 Tax=Actinophytocola oryzae TaxID=502181 RepID=A0A4V3FS00_9PSEU|nr:hypothetical protein [Actinophytocola oryzae]TDV45511.1 hypothetical protein CLV71_112179 [Actinophytocola oryzae]